MTMNNNVTKYRSFSNAIFDTTGIGNMASVRIETLYNREIKIMALCCTSIQQYAQAVLHCPLKQLIYLSCFHFT